MRVHSDYLRRCFQVIFTINLRYWLRYYTDVIASFLRQAATVAAWTLPCHLSSKEITVLDDPTLTYRTLDTNSQHLRVYSDVSFASNDDHSSQLGYLVLRTGDKNNCVVLAYCSKKSKRVVRSIMVDEIFAFAAALDHAFVIQHDLKGILGRPIGHIMFTDSKKMFDVITKYSHTIEKRLMIEVTASREAINRC